jgi:hypothetical protein
MSSPTAGQRYVLMRPGLGVFGGLLDGYSTMTEFHTAFGSLRDYTKGELEIINDDPKNYAFSNVFDVAAKSRPYEKVVVAINLEYVLEVLRAEGTSPWFAAPHDEFAIIMDGYVEVELVKLDSPDTVVPPTQRGASAFSALPPSRPMGRVKCKRGHQALLPRGAAYRFIAPDLGVILLQTIEGPLSVKKWRDICYK